MTRRCTDADCPCPEHDVNGFDHGQVPTCPHCSALLYDSAGKPLTRDAVVGWCHSRHRHSSQPWTSYQRGHWIWRLRVFYPDAYMPASEAAELAAAAAADPTDPPMTEEQRWATRIT